jgi:tRNA pseudouridine13 synthase
MREAHPREREMGMEWYVSDADGTGGELRVADEDFVVQERERFDVELHPPDADTGAYPHLVFRATLRGWDTNDFASALSKQLGLSRERVSWAGTKDKHAVTTQLFSVRHEAADLPDLNDADIEVLGRAGRPVLFGDLAGNAFELRVRNTDAPEHADAITESLRAFAAADTDADNRSDDAPAGVPNYFGHQRFGAYRPVTHRAGLAVVRRDWADAVLTYVTQTSAEEPAETREAREFVAETHDWEAALDRLPGQLRYERAMCHTLAERVGSGDPTDEDWRAALESLPSNLQSMLVNAVQSYAFNLMLSERLKRGLPFARAVAGDVVCFADQTATGSASASGGSGGPNSVPEIALPDTDRLQRVDGDRVDTVNRHCARGRAFVTAPLVGTETDLADGEQGDIEREVLDDLDLAPGDFDLPGAFESTGTRRAVLLRTHLDVERVEDDPDSLRFAFALPKGSYATVVLREFLKGAPMALS